MDDEQHLNAEELSLEDIEAAYLRALEAAEEADAIFSEVEVDDANHSVTCEEVEHQEEVISSQVSGPTLHAPTDAEDALELDGDQRLTPSQVIEGLLFVGGKPLPAKKICDVLGGSITHEQVDIDIIQLNNLYQSQNRPYEIRLVEGGYKMTLLAEYEGVRSKVYGHGPKEVKLTQEVLEILAFVAYQQPVTKEEVQDTGKENVGGILRQLLRRELVHLDRGETDTYHTTHRFLELFGLSHIADLPQAIDFNFK